MVETPGPSKDRTTCGVPYASGLKEQREAGHAGKILVLLLSSLGS